MKHFLIFLGLFLGACGAPFTSSPFTSTEEVAGAQTIGSGAGSGGDSSQSGAGGAPDPMARAGSGGSAGVAGEAGSIDAAGAAGAPAEPPPVLYTPPACSTEQNVTGGYDSSLSAAPACLRTREALNTIACTNYDGRSITVNGVPAVCGVPQAFSESVDGYKYIALGAGTAGNFAIRWFLTAPVPNPCAARSWVEGDLYAPGEIMIGACDAPGSQKSCELGKSYAFACAEDPGTHCSSVGPGAIGWTSVWTLIRVCG